jgi:hypothetical protein
MRVQKPVRRWVGCLVASGLTVGLAGCIHAQAPERIEINVGGRPAPVDSRTVPHPGTLADAQQELDKAYQNMRYLEQDNARLLRKVDEYQRERDEARKELKQYRKERKD